MPVIEMPKPRLGIEYITVMREAQPFTCEFVSFGLKRSISL